MPYLFESFVDHQDNVHHYVTLGPNRPNEHVLKEIRGSWQDATVRGNLRQEGWGAEIGYPGIDLDKKVKVINE